MPDVCLAGCFGAPVIGASQRRMVLGPAALVSVG
jgi:hypothetical protein